MSRLNPLIKFFNNLLILLRANKKKYLIVFGYSPFQGNLIANLKLNFSEFRNKKFLLFDFNRTTVGRNQFENNCIEYSDFINYIGKINTITLIFILIINSIKRINILHGNYNSLSFKILTFICAKNLSALDDGSNTFLMPFRIKRKFKKFYTIFPSIIDNKRLKNYVEITLIKQNKLNNKCSEKLYDKTKIFLCGSADTEEKIISENDYLNLITLTISHLKKYKFTEIIYYPHRRECNEKQKKINYILKNNFSEVISPELSFDEFYIKNNLNCSAVSFTSTLEKSLNYKLKHNDVNFIPIRYALDILNENYILEYSIISASLSSDLPREKILLYFNKKLINYIQLIESISFKKSYFKEIRNTNLTNFIKNYLKNNYVNKWKGQMIYIDEKEKIYTVYSWKDFTKLNQYLQIAPDLMIGKY